MKYFGLLIFAITLTFFYSNKALAIGSCQPELEAWESATSDYLKALQDPENYDIFAAQISMENAAAAYTKCLDSQVKEAPGDS